MNDRHLTLSHFPLPALHNLIVHHHPFSCTLTYKLRFAFLDTFHSPTSHVIFSTIPSEAPRLLSIALCINTLGLSSRLRTIVHVQHDAIIICSAPVGSAPGTNSRDAGE